MPLNLGPNPSMMRRILGGTNALAQGMGGPLGSAAGLTAGLNQNRLMRGNPQSPAGPSQFRVQPQDLGMAPVGMPTMMNPPSTYMGNNRGGQPDINSMGGFPRPNIETGNMVNDAMPQGGLWQSFMRNRRPMLG